MMHNSPIYEEFQTPSAKILTLPRKQDHLDNSNDISKPDIPTISKNLTKCFKQGSFHCRLGLNTASLKPS